MADPEKPPIPRELAEAFHNAVAELRGWTLGGKEPEVTYQFNSHLISAICEQVTAYDDPVPECRGTGREGGRANGGKSLRSGRLATQAAAGPGAGLGPML
jgi:hypothetical protein